MTTNERQRYEHFYSLVERHKSLIESMCMRRSSGDSRFCSELRQECYITILKHEKRIDTDILPLQETLWVYWLCRSAFSRLRFLDRTHLYIPLDEIMADTIAAPDESNLGEYIESVTSVLNPHERRAVELMAEGYTPDEMAHVLGIKPRSAVQLRYRIIAKLRQHYRSDNNK